jgi:hypothetical protein
MTSPLEVRQELVDALQLDLVGPTGPLGNPKELLTQTPSRWYLTGFLVPTDADEQQRSDPTSSDEMDQTPAVANVDENETPENSAARRSYLPSSMGISVLFPAGATELDAVVRYGEYMRIDTMKVTLAHNIGSVFHARKSLPSRSAARCQAAVSFRCRTAVASSWFGRFAEYRTLASTAVCPRERGAYRCSS